MTVTDGRKDAEGHYRAQMIEWFSARVESPSRILVDTIYVLPPQDSKLWEIHWEEISLDPRGLPSRYEDGELVTHGAHYSDLKPDWYREDGNW